MWKSFKTFVSEVWWWRLSQRHTLASVSRNDDGSMDITCKRGCQSRLRVHKHEGDRTKTLGDRLQVESTNCPYYIEFRKRFGQAHQPLPDARLN